MRHKWCILIITVTALSTFAYSQDRAMLSSGNEMSSLTAIRGSQAEDRSKEVGVDGIYLKAFAAAFEEFKNDSSIPAELRRLEDYTVFFSREKECIKVSFFSKSHEKAPQISGAMEGEMEYCISEKSFAVLYRVHPK